MQAYARRQASAAFRWHWSTRVCKQYLRCHHTRSRECRALRRSHLCPKSDCKRSHANYFKLYCCFPTLIDRSSVQPLIDAFHLSFSAPGCSCCVGVVPPLSFHGPAEADDWPPCPWTACAPFVAVGPFRWLRQFAGGRPVKWKTRRPHLWPPGSIVRSWRNGQKLRWKRILPITPSLFGPVASK